MKVLHILVGAEIGGAERICSSIVHNLNDQVKVIVMKGPGAASGWFKGLDIEHLYLNKPFMFPVTLWRLVKLFFGSWDIVHCHCFYACVLGVAYKILRLDPYDKKTNLIWHEHMGGYSGWKRFFAEELGKKASLILAPSAKALKEVGECLFYSSNKLAILRNGIEIRSTGKRKEHGKFVCGFAGRINDHVKGYDRFIDIINRLDGVLGLVASAERPKDDTGIEWWPHGKNGDMDDFYESVDVLVVPSRNEGMPLVILEAMAHGKPIIAANAGGIPEIVSSENGFLFNDVKEAVEAVKSLRNDENLRKKIGETNRLIAVKKYNSDLMVEWIKKAYALLKRHGRNPSFKLADFYEF